MKLINYFVPHAFFVKFRLEQYGMYLCSFRLNFKTYRWFYDHNNFFQTTNPNLSK